MTIEAHLADGRVLEFPDGTSQKVIDKVVLELVNESRNSSQSAETNHTATFGKFEVTIEGKYTK